MKHACLMTRLQVDGVFVCGFASVHFGGNTFMSTRARSCGALFDTLEHRRLLTLVAPSISFGDGGYTSFGRAFEIYNGRLADAKLTATADGRLVVTDNFSAYFLKGDGTLDTARRPDGRLGTAARGSFPTVDSAVDPNSGRIAVIRQRLGKFMDLNLYDAKGKYLGYVTMNAYAGDASTGTLHSVAFAPNGDVLIGGVATTVRGDNEAHKVAMIRRYTPRLQPVASFGNAGQLTFDITPLTDTADADQVARLHSITTDASGGFTAVSSYGEPLDGGSFSTRVWARRFSSAGKPVAEYGGEDQQERVLFMSGRSASSFEQRTVADVASDSFGNLYTLVKESVGADTATKQAIRLLRTRPDGETETYDIVTGVTLDRPLGTPSVAVGPNGTVYVSTREGGAVTQLYKFETENGTQFRLDEDFSSFGNYASTTTSVGDARLSTDAKGRIFLTGIGDNEHFLKDYGVLAAAGSIEGREGRAGTARVMGDGTLVLKGRKTADSILIRTRQNDLLIEFNGAKLLFAKKGIRGIYVQGGNGSDRIELSPSVITPAYVEAGAGNDTVRGSISADTIIGGSGNDWLWGGPGGDDLYGQDGNDTLLGSAGPDRLYGSRGDDTIDTLRIDSLSPPTDGQIDFVSSGSGRDRITLDQLVNDPNKDDEFLPLGSFDVLTRGA